MAEKLTQEEIGAAIAKVINRCEYMTNVQGEYRVIRVRDLLVDLGYEKQLPQLLTAIAEGGFSYCLDHEIPCQSGIGGEPGEIYPEANVCYWGPDQIASRLHGVHLRTSRR